MNIWQGDIDSLLETTSDGRVKLPRDVRGTQDEDTIVVCADTVHLDEELSLDAPRGLILALTSASAERVNLIYEDDGRFVLSRKLEELLDETLRLSQPFADEVRGADREEGAVGLGCTGFGEIGLTRTRGSIEEDTSPGLPLSSK